jgi:uncharacterized protein (TIRG00374 family)
MRASSRKLLLFAAALVVLGFLLYRSRGFFHLADFSGAKLLHAIHGASYTDLLLAIVIIYLCYAVRALRWQVFQRNLGRAKFGNIYRMTLAGFAAVFLLGRAGEPIRPLLLARKGELPIADTFGIWVLERLFDTASTAVLAVIGLMLFTAGPHAGEMSASMETAARTTGSVLGILLLGSVAGLVYLRLHGTALLEKRLALWHEHGGWRAVAARIMLGFIRGVQTIRTWSDLAYATAYSALHWFLVVLIYYLASISFGGQLGQITISDAMVLLAFTMVGSAIQLPGVGGGSQVACFVAYTKVFGVEQEPAAAAAIVVWLITFAACSFAGVPLLIHEGVSLGKLKQLAEQEKEELKAVAEGAAPEGLRHGGTAE